MSTNSESGHIKNVANFELLITFCNNCGQSYNPSNTAISVSAIQTKLADVKTKIQNVTDAKSAYKNATNNREILFEPLKQLSSRIIKALKAVSATQQTIDDAITMHRKIHGTRAVKKPNKTNTPESEQLPAESTEEPKTHSVSQLSFDNMPEHFSNLIAVLAREPLYQPNETELQLTTLTTLLNDMRLATAEVVAKELAYETTLIERNEEMYNRKTGLVALAFEVKNYTFSVFGSSNPVYKQISALRFTREVKL